MPPNVALRDSFGQPRLEYPRCSWIGTHYSPLFLGDDVIIHGIETIGSAERSNDPGEMEEQFHTISDGKYAGKLFELFGRERVENELNEFLVLPHFPRFGGGIGLTRFIKGMKASGLLTAGDHC